jgi:polyisoprenoid-binding protein YceI
MNWQFRFKQAPVAGLFLLVCAAQMAAAQNRAPSGWPAEAIIHFSATSTLHDFGGELPAQPFVLTIATNHWGAEADVLSGLMNTGSEGRDNSMHKMFNTNDHPRIHGKVTAAPIPAKGTTNATLTLKIRDQQNSLPVVISDWTETDSNLTFHAEWKLSLKQFKLKPPSVLGVLRVGDIVTLAADVTAHKKPALTNTAAVPTVPADK